MIGRFTTNEKYTGGYGCRSELGEVPKSEEAGELRSTRTGDLLRELFREGTKPSSEEIARRLGYEPLDTGPLVADLSASS